MEVKAMKQAITLKGATLKDATPKDTTLKDTTLKEAESCIYEKVYFALCEMGQRYSEFVQFRVIGRSHDDRMIPMLEIGTGDTCIFCVAGFSGVDWMMSDRLTEVTMELCRNYECGWMVKEFYEVKKLLDTTRLCIIPVVNPDGYEICRRGYGAVRNPIFRQMLKMQDIPCDEFVCNARGMNPVLNFPTSFSSRKKIHQQPASDKDFSGIWRQRAACFLRIREKNCVLSTGPEIFHRTTMSSSCQTFEEMHRWKIGAVSYRE